MRLTSALLLVAARLHVAPSCGPCMMLLLVEMNLVAVLDDWCPLSTVAVLAGFCGPLACALRACGGARLAVGAARGRRRWCSPGSRPVHRAGGLTRVQWSHLVTLDCTGGAVGAARGRGGSELDRLPGRPSGCFQLDLGAGHATI